MDSNLTDSVQVSYRTRYPLCDILHFYEFRDHGLELYEFSTPIG